MLEKLFCFGGRMGRLEFFGWNFAGAAVSFVVAFVLIITAMLMSGSTHIPTNPRDQGYLVSVGTAIVTFWISFALQTKRLRDMGRDPFVWIVGVWTVLLFDQYVLTIYTAARYPSLVFGVYTPLGSLVCVVYSFFLLFSPSADEVQDSPVNLDRRFSRG